MSSPTIDDHDLEAALAVQLARRAARVRVRPIDPAQLRGNRPGLTPAVPADRRHHRDQHRVDQHRVRRGVLVAAAAIGLTGAAVMTLAEGRSGPVMTETAPTGPAVTTPTPATGADPTTDSGAAPSTGASDRARDPAWRSVDLGFLPNDAGVSSLDALAGTFVMVTPANGDIASPSDRQGLPHYRDDLWLSEDGITWHLVPGPAGHTAVQFLDGPGGMWVLTFGVSPDTAGAQLWTIDEGYQPARQLPSLPEPTPPTADRQWLGTNHPLFAFSGDRLIMAMGGEFGPRPDDGEQEMVSLIYELRPDDTFVLLTELPGYPLNVQGSDGLLRVETQQGRRRWVATATGNPAVAADWEIVPANEDDESTPARDWLPPDPEPTAVGEWVPERTEYGAWRHQWHGPDDRARHGGLSVVNGGRRLMLTWQGGTESTFRAWVIDRVDSQDE